MCRCVLVDTGSSFVCINCGVEKTYVSPNCVSFHHTPHTSLIISPYNRKTRFLGLLRKILGVDTGPQISDRVWRYLSASAPFRTTDDIVTCLKNSSLKTKHYNCIHGFSKAFMKNYSKPKCHYSPLEIEKHLGTLFEEVVFYWCRFSKQSSFFSYAWLLEKLFRQLQILEDYKAFLKVLICPNRRKKYETRWNMFVTKSPHIN